MIPQAARMIAKIDQLNLTHRKWRSAKDFQQLGIAGFEALDSNAAPAVDKLTALLADKQHAFTAVRCLVAIGPPAEAGVVQALTNLDENVRYFAALKFVWVTDDTRDFLAHMKVCLANPGASVRSAAVGVVGLQTQAPDCALPSSASVTRSRRFRRLRSGRVTCKFRNERVARLPDLTNAVQPEGSTLLAPPCRHWWPSHRTKLSLWSLLIFALPTRSGDGLRLNCSGNTRRLILRFKRRLDNLPSTRTETWLVPRLG